MGLMKVVRAAIITGYVGYVVAQQGEIKKHHLENTLEPSPLLSSDSYSACHTPSSPPTSSLDVISRSAASVSSGFSSASMCEFIGDKSEHGDDNDDNDDNNSAPVIPSSMRLISSGASESFFVPSVPIVPSSTDSHSRKGSNQSNHDHCSFSDALVLPSMSLLSSGGLGSDCDSTASDTVNVPSLCSSLDFDPSDNFIIPSQLISFDHGSGFDLSSRKASECFVPSQSSSFNFDTDFGLSSRTSSENTASDSFLVPSRLSSASGCFIDPSELEPPLDSIIDPPPLEPPSQLEPPTKSFSALSLLIGSSSFSSFSSDSFRPDDDDDDGHPNFCTVDPATGSAPCLNGGTCVNLDTTYVCICEGLYSGPRCATLPDACAPSPCENGAGCVSDNSGGFQCSCLPGYTGERCDLCAPSTFLGAQPEAVGSMGGDMITLSFIDFPVATPTLVSIEGIEPFWISNPTEYVGGDGGEDGDGTNASGALGTTLQFAAPPCAEQAGCSLGEHLVTLLNPCSQDQSSFTLTYFDNSPDPAVLSVSPSDAVMQVPTHLTIRLQDVPLPVTLPVPSSLFNVVVAGMDVALLEIHPETQSIVVLTPVVTVTPGLVEGSVTSSLLGVEGEEEAAVPVTVFFSLLLKSNVPLPGISFVNPSFGGPGDEVSITVSNLDGNGEEPQVSDVTVNFDSVSAAVSPTSFVVTAGSVSFSVAIPDLGLEDLAAELSVEVAGVLQMEPVSFTYVAPLLPSILYASTLIGLEGGGDTLDLRVGGWDSSTLPMASLTISFGEVVVDLGDVTVSPFATNTYTVSVIIPPGVAGSQVNVVVGFEGAGVSVSVYEELGAYFEYVAASDPYLGTHYPIEGETGGGDAMVVTIINFDAAVASVVSVSFTQLGGGVVETPADVQPPEDGVLRFESPAVGAASDEAAAAAVGVYEVQITWFDVNTGDAYAVSFEFTYVLPPTPDLGAMGPAEGPNSGDTLVSVTINHFPPVLFSSSISVVVDGWEAVVVEVEASNELSTRFTFLTPPTSVGVVDVEFRYLTPTGFESQLTTTFSAYDATQPLVNSVTPSAYFEAGGVTLKISVEKFPGDRVAEDVSDFSVTLGDQVCSDLRIYSSSLSTTATGDQVSTVFTCIMPVVFPDASGSALLEVSDVLAPANEIIPSWSYSVWSTPIGSPIVNDVSPKRASVGVTTAVTVTVGRFGAVSSEEEIRVDVILSDGTPTSCDVTGYLVFQEFAKILCGLNLEGVTSEQKGGAGGTVYKTELGEASGALFVMDVVSLYDPQVEYFYPAIGTSAGGTVVTVSLLYYSKISDPASLLISISDAQGSVVDVPTSFLELLSSVQDATLLTFVTPVWSGESETTVTISMADSTSPSSFALTLNPLPTGPATAVYVKPADFSAPTSGGTDMAVLLGSSFFVRTVEDVVVRFSSTGLEPPVVVGVDVVAVTWVGVNTKVEFSSPVVDLADVYTVEIFPQDRETNVFVTAASLYDLQPARDFLFPYVASPGELITVGIVNYWVDPSVTLTVTVVESGTIVEDAALTITDSDLGKLTVTFTLDFTLPGIPDLEEGEKVVLVATSDGQSYTDTVYYVPPSAPRLNYILPPSGPSYGGTSVQLSLLNFVADGGAVSVWFGGEKATGVVLDQIDSLLLVTCLSPPQLEPGLVYGEVTVDMDPTVSVAFEYTYVTAVTPSLTVMTPSIGASSGGDVVYMEVQDLPAASSGSLISVKFDATFVAVTMFSQVGSLSKLVVTSPAWESGAGYSSVQIYRSDVSLVKATGQFLYFDATAPRVSLTPSPVVGTVSGGVVLYGEFENINVVSSVSELTFYCGSETGVVAQIMVSTSEELKLSLVTPAGSEGAVVCGVYRTLDGVENAATWGFEYVSARTPLLTLVSPTEGSYVGGDTIRVEMSNFPVVSAPSEVTLFFGTTDVNPVLIEYSNSDATAFFVNSVEWGVAETVSVTVSPTADSTLSVSFEFKYVSPPAPTFSFISAVSGLQAGGDEVEVSLSNFPVVTDPTDVVALFGTLEASVVRVTSTSPSSTSLVVSTPASSVEESVTLLFYSKRLGPSLAATLDSSSNPVTFRFIGASPVLDYMHPASGSSTGGTKLTLALSNVDALPAVVSVTVGGEVVDVALSQQDGGITLGVTTPSFVLSATGGGEYVDVVVDVDGWTESQSFWYYDATLPFISFVYPITGPKTGGTRMSMTVTQLQAGLSQPTDVTVLFGALKATVSSVSQTNEGLTEIELTVPAYAGFGPVTVTVLPVGVTDLSTAPTMSFEYFTTCDFVSYCYDTLSGRGVDEEYVVDTPPADDTCSVVYCAPEPPPAPYIVSSSPGIVSNAGGDVLSVSIAYLPVVEFVGDVRVTLNGVVAPLVTLKLSTAESTVLEVTLPQIAESGVMDVVVMELTSAPVVSLGFSLDVYAEPEGAPVISAYYPPKFDVGKTSPTFVTLTNCPVVSLEKVAVSVGTQSMSITQVVSSPAETTLYFNTPGDVCVSDCSEVMLLSVTSRLGPVLVVEEMLVFALPQMVVSLAFPTLGSSDGGDVIQLSLTDAPVDAAEGDVSVTINDDVGSIEAGSFSHLPAGSGAVSFGLVVPPNPAGTYQARVSALGQDAYFEFTYFDPNLPRVTYISPETVPTTGGEKVTVFVSAMNRTGLEILGCDGVPTSFSPGAAAVEITVTTPACPRGEHAFQLTNSAGQTLSLTLAYVAPPPTLTNEWGSPFIYAERTHGFEITVWGLPPVTDVGAQVKMSFDGVEGGGLTGASLEGDWTAVTGQTPSVTTQTQNQLVWVEVWHVDAVDQVQGLWVTFMMYPTLNYMAPVEGFVSGGADMVIAVDYLPEGLGATGLDIRFGETRVIVSKVVSSMVSTSIFVTVPRATATGPVTMWIGWDNLQPEANFGLYPTFTYIASPPTLSSIHPVRAGLSGGELVTVVISHLNVVSSVDEVVAGTATRAWVVDSIIFSDVTSTSLVLEAPKMTAPGAVVLEVGNAFQSVFVSFQFYDSNLAVLEPGSDIVGAEEGGTEFDIVVTNFPLVTGPGDVILKFGTTFGTVVNTAVSNDGATTTFSARSPGYTKADYTDGRVTLDCSLLLLAAPANIIYLPFTYRAPVRAISAAFQAGYSWIDVRLNQPTTEGSSGAASACHSLLDASMLTLLGHDPADVESKNCLWPAPHLLRVLYLGSASLKPGELLLLQTGSLNGVDDLDGLTALGTNLGFSSSFGVTVDGDPFAPDPAAVISGPTELGFCDALWADASGSSGTKITFNWGCRNDADVNSVLLSATGSSISVEKDHLTKIGFTYELTLTVTDFAGVQSAEEVLYVTRSSLPLPSIVILGRSYLTPQPDESVFVVAGAEFSSCATPEQLTFEWEQVVMGSENVVTPAAGVNANGANLYIPANLMSAGVTYYFRVFGFPAGDSLNRGSADVVVAVQLPPLIATITGGDRTVSSTQDLVLDASSSSDPSGQTTSDSFDYEWWCEAWDVVSEVWLACRDASQDLVSLPASSSLTFAAGTLRPGLYSLSCFVTVYPRGSYASAVITIVDEVIPEVSIFRDASITPIRASGMVNSDDKVVLGTVVGLDHLPGEVAAGAELTYEWVLTPSDGVDLNIPAVSPTGASGASLAINSFVLEAGRTYTAIVTVSLVGAGNGYGVGEASHTIVVNSPPTPGTCEIQPKTGDAMSTLFTVVCGGWKDDSGLPLTYSYSTAPMDSSGTVGDLCLLVPPGPGNTLLDFTLPAGAADSGGLLVNFQVMDKDGASRTVTELIEVVEPWATEEERAAAMYEVVNGHSNELLQKGDSTAAFNSVGAVATSAGGGSGVNRVRVRERKLRVLGQGGAGEGGGGRGLEEEEVPLGMQLLDIHIAARGGAVITPENVQTSISSLQGASKRATEWSLEYLHLGFSELEAFGPVIKDMQMQSTLGGIFLSTLHNMVASGAITQGPVLSNGDRSDLTSSIHNSVSSALFPLVSALLNDLVVNQAGVEVSGGEGQDVMSLAVSKLHSGVVLTQTHVTPHGSSCVLPTDIGDLFSSASNVAVVAYDVPHPWWRPSLEFASEVHAFLLVDPAQAHDGIRFPVQDLGSVLTVTIPVNPDVDFITGDVLPECRYFTESLEWAQDDATCAVVSFDNENVVCECNRHGEFVVTTTPRPVRTWLIDDYMTGCVIFEDCDNDGVMGAEEGRCTTVSDSDEHTGSCLLPVVSEGGECPVRYLHADQPSSCKDRGTNQDVKVNLVAAPSSTQLTILTTIMVKLTAPLAEGGKDLTAAQAKSMVTTAFNTPSCDIETCNPVASATAVDSTANQREGLATMASLHAIIAQVDALVQGEASAATLAALVDTVGASTGQMDLSNPEEVGQLLTAAVAGAGDSQSVTGDELEAAAAASAAANFNLISAAHEGGGGLLSVLNERAVTAQVELAALMGAMVTESISLDDFISQADDVNNLTENDDGAEPRTGAGGGGGGAGAIVGSAVGVIVGVGVTVFVSIKVRKARSKAHAVTMPVSDFMNPQAGPIDL